MRCLLWLRAGYSYRIVILERCESGNVDMFSNVRRTFVILCDVLPYEYDQQVDRMLVYTHVEYGVKLYPRYAVCEGVLLVL